MPWLTDDIADNLLGNARPKSFDACMQDQWWAGVFDRWWHEGAASKPMYAAVRSIYNDMSSYYSGQMDEASFYEEWVNDPPNVTLIDAGARDAFAQAHRNGQDVTPAMGRLWDATAAQMQMVYAAFYDDVGVTKEQLRREGVQAAIAEAFPTL
jgi:hypothetical protein